jgi:hypothetical protein
MKRRNLFIMVGVLAGSVGVISNARAVDDKFFPGVGCLPDPGTTGTPFFFNGTIGNLSTTAKLNVHCPLVRDGNDIQQGKLRAFDRNPNSGADVICTVIWEDYSINTTIYLADSEPISTVDSGNGIMERNFGSVNLGPSSGSYYAACSIPPMTGSASHIVNFRLTEGP